MNVTAINYYIIIIYIISGYSSRFILYLFNSTGNLIENGYKHDLSVLSYFILSLTSSVKMLQGICGGS